MILALLKFVLVQPINNLQYLAIKMYCSLSILVSHQYTALWRTCSNDTPCKQAKT